MSALREAATGLARTGVYPLLSIERLFASERVAAGLEARRTRQVAPLEDLFERAADAGAASLSAGDLRRLLAAIWAERTQAALAARIVERAVTIKRRSVDRAIIDAYLCHYPANHRAFDVLRTAAGVAADRHDWRWREAGSRWHVWDGPGALGEGLREAPDPDTILREAGFVGRLADGAFVSAARSATARQAAP